MIVLHLKKCEMGRKILDSNFGTFFLPAILKDDLLPALVPKIENCCGDNKKLCFFIYFYFFF